MWGLKKNLLRASRRFSEIIGAIDDISCDNRAKKYKNDFAVVQNYLSVIQNVVQEMTEMDSFAVVAKMTGVKKNMVPERRFHHELQHEKFGSADGFLGEMLRQMSHNFDLIATERETMIGNLRKEVLEQVHVFKEVHLKPLQAAQEFMEQRRLSYDSLKEGTPQKTIELQKYKSALEDYFEKMSVFFSKDIEILKDISYKLLQLYHKGSSDVASCFRDSLQNFSNLSVSGEASINEDSQYNGEDRDYLNPPNPTYYAKYAKVRVLFDLNEDDEDVVKASEGDILYMVDQIDDNWIAVCHDPESDLDSIKSIPTSYVEFLS